MYVYLVYKYDRCDNDRTDLKVFLNEVAAEKFRKEQPHDHGVEFHVEAIEAEGFS